MSSNELQQSSLQSDNNTTMFTISRPFRVGGPASGGHNIDDTTTKNNGTAQTGKYTCLAECSSTVRRNPVGLAHNARATFISIVEKMHKYAETRHKQYQPAANYTDVFNSWMGSVDYVSYEEKTLHYSSDDEPIYWWKVTRTITFHVQGRQTGRPLRITSMVIDSQLKRGRNRVCYALFKELRKLNFIQGHNLPQFQADDGRPVSQESIQGQVDQQSVSAVNTIITRDTTQTESIDAPGDNTQNIASSELIHTFPTLTDRWMPLQNFEVLTSQARGTNIVSLVLPKDLYTKAKCAPNIAPFEAFVYGALSIEIRIVMNANKFQAGKIVASYRPDAYQADGICSGTQAMLTRPHVILDLAARNEGVMKIPWKYHAPFMRLVMTAEQSTAAQAGTFAVLDINTLSPLVVADGGVTSAYGQIFYRIVKTEFAGMSYRVSFQGDTGVDDMIRSMLPIKTIGAVVSGLETAVKQLGASTNQDKPNNPVSNVIVPRPRSMFPNVKGYDDATQLRPNVVGSTNYDKIPPIKEEPQSPKELARVWGLRTTSKWKTGDKVGDRILSLPVDPTCRDVPYYTASTPLEYAMSMFNFWNGTIELRIDFVSTSFHQGSIMLSVEFGRPVNTNDVCSTASTYTKVFHLGEQRSVTMTVPYIYDTVYRRSNGAITRLLVNDGEFPASQSDLRQGLSLALDVHTVVRATIINALKPVQNVASEIELLVFWRAGENFSMMGLKQNDSSALEANNANNYLRNLPSDFTGTFASLPAGAVRVQADTGEKETEDKTATFSAGVSAVGVQNSDDIMDFKDILRRPTMIQFNIAVAESTKTSGTNISLGHFIPVRPPSRSFVVLTNKALSTEWCMGGIAASPSTSIVNLFRFWRGSSKYTFHFSPSSTCNLILITYIPHSGIQMRGDRNFPTVVTDLKAGFSLPFMSGYATEMVVPSVNPTVSIVVPYETENNWTYTWETDPSANYTWRDKGNLNAGHVVIQPIGGTVTMSTWWSAGDDFQLACYWGMPYVYNEAIKWRMNENGSYPTAAASVTPEVAKVITKLGLKLDSATVAPSKIATNTTTSTTSTTTPRTQAPTTTVRAHVRVEPEPEPTSSYVNPHRHHHGYTEEDIRRDLERVRAMYLARNPQPTNRQIRRYLKDRSKAVYGRVLPEYQADNEDFHLSNTLTRVGSVLKKISPKLVRNATIAMVPVVGPPLAMATIASELSETAGKTLNEVGTAVHKVTDAAETITDKLAHLADRVGNSVDAITALLGQAVDTASGMLVNIANGTSLVFDMLLDVFIAWYDKSWTAVGVGIVRLLAKVMPRLVISTVLSIGRDLGNVISRWVLESTTPSLQADDNNTTHVLVGLLAGLVGTITGVALDVNPYVGFASRLLRRVTTSSGVMYFVHMINFVKAVFEVVKEMVMSALGMVSPEAEALRALSGKSEEIQKFIRDAQEVTSEVNQTMLALPAYRVRAWRTVMQAYQLQQLMTQVPNNVVSPVLSRLCMDVIKMGNEKFLDMASCPVRYEPFVICIEGETNIGKSFMIESLVAALLDSVGYDAPISGLMYVRQPGSEYWSGMRDQPVVLYDEWMQSNDPHATNVQLLELYQLKTPALFVPNMAHLDEKKIRANPLIVVLACNDAFPNLNSVHTPAAILRRRDVVIRASKDAQYANISPRYLPDEVKDTFGHLNFSFYADTANQDSLDPTVFDYQEMLAELVDHFKDYHDIEQRSVKKRLDGMFAVNRSVPASLLTISDPFKIFYSVQGPGEALVADADMWVASQRLAADTEEIYRRIQDPAVQARLDGVRQQVLNPPPVGEVVEQGPLRVVLTCLKWYFTSTMAPIAYGAYVVSRALYASGRQAIEWQKLESVTINCAVCFENKPAHYVCSGEFDHMQHGQPMRHGVCDECWETLDRVGNASNCPVCRSSGRHPILSENEASTFTRLMMMIGSGAIVSGDIWSTISQIGFMFYDVQRFCYFVEHMLLFFISDFPCSIIVPWVITADLLMVGEFFLRGGSLNPMEPTTLPFGGDAPINSYFQADDGEQVLSQPSTSSASAEEQPESEEESLNGENQYHLATASTPQSVAAHRRLQRANRRQEIIQAVVNIEDTVNGVPDNFRLLVHDLNARGVRQVKHHGPCAHRKLDTVYTTVRYIGCKWQFMDAGVVATIPDGLCASSATSICYWEGERGEAIQRNFYTKYMQDHRRALIGNMYGWNGSDTVGQRDAHAGKIPDALKPEWMFNPILLDNQARDMTSTSWWQYLSEIYDEYRVLLNILGAVTLACTSLVAGYEIYKYMFSSTTSATQIAATKGLAAVVTIEPQSPPQQSQHVRPTQVRRGPPPRTVRHQADIDEAVERYILRNTVTIELREDDEAKQVFHGLGVCGHKVLIPKHYIKMMRYSQYSVWIGPTSHSFKRHTYTWDDKDFVEFANNDLAIWTWPASTDSFKDIRKFFITEADLRDRPLPRDAVLYVAPGRHAQCMHAVEVQLEGACASTPVIDSDGTVSHVVDVLMYNFSRNGACGSTLTTTNTQRPILGIHVAGQGYDLDGTGYSVIVTQEILVRCEPDAPEPPEIPLESMDSAHTVFSQATQVMYQGALPPTKVPHIPHKSKLERSSVYGMQDLTADIFPAILSHKDPRYTHDLTPLVCGAEAHGRQTVDFSTTDLEGPTMFLRDLFTTLKPSVVDPKRLTMDQVVCGLRDTPYYDPMDLKTSVGYPLMLRNIQKQDVISVERDEDMYPIRATVDPEVCSLIDSARKVRMRGERYPTLWVDTLKDEKRPLAKLMARGGTRIICNGPLEHAMSMRANFLHFAAAFMRDRDRMYHCVGINPVSREWDILAARLLNKNHKVTTLDYTNFGPGLNSRVLQIVCDLIVEWTLQHVGDVSEMELKMLMVEIVNSYHICTNTVYSQNSGAPSGNVLTSVINSLVNIMYVLVAWQNIVGDKVMDNGKIIFEEFKRCVCLRVYGDDAIMTVKDYSEDFNGKTIAEFFETYGIVATDSSKAKVVVPYTDITQAEFLKRRFVRHPVRDIWMSCLRGDTVKSTTQWVWKSPNRDLTTRVNCEVSLLNAHGFGPERFEEFRQTLNKALVAKKIPPFSATWNEIDVMIYDKGATWAMWL